MLKLDERFCCLFSICVSPAAENRRRANIVVYIIVNGLVSEKGGHFGAQTAHQKVKQKSNIFSYKRNFQRSKKRAKGRIIPLRKQKTRTESLIRTWTPKQTRTRTFTHDTRTRTCQFCRALLLRIGVHSKLGL